MYILKKFSTAPGALNLKPIGVDYVQTFLWYHSPVDYIEHIEQEEHEKKKEKNLKK